MPIDNRGTYLYAESDLEANASTLLNRRAVQEATIPWEPLTLKPGFTGNPAARIINGRVEFRGSIGKSSGTFPQTGSGDIVATLPSAAYRPPSYTRLLRAGYAHATPNAMLLTVSDQYNDIYAASVGTALSTVYLAGISWGAA